MAIRKASTSNILNTVHRDASAATSKISDIPDTPTIGTATAGAESATITYTVANTGGIGTTFTALSNPGSITGTGSSPITVSGLTAATAYTFTVKSGNTTGDSPYSSASNSVTALEGGSFVSIATVTLGSESSTLTFNSIPSTYKHLQIRGVLPATSIVNALITFNGDNENNYWWQWLGGDGANVSTNKNSSAQPYIISGLTSFNTNTAIGAATVMDIFDYSSTTKHKTVKSFNGFDDNTSHVGYIPVTLSSGVWNSTSAITSITFTVSGGYGWRANGQLALYGIKG
jgi:hypothetical protein